MSETTAITDLAACYSVGLQKRFVFFQTSDARIHAYDVQSSAGVGGKSLKHAQLASRAMQCGAC